MNKPLRLPIAVPRTDEPKKRGRRPGKSVFLYRTVADLLRDHLRQGRFAAGERLPGNEELAQELNVNRLTLRRAISDLIAEGWLVAQPSRGTFVGERGASGAKTAPRGDDVEARQALRAPDPPRTVALVSNVFQPSTPGAYHLEFLNAVRHELLKLGCALVMPPGGPDADGDPDAPFAPGMDAGGLLLLGPCQEARLAAAVRDGRPAVLLDADAGSAPIDSVVVDNIAIGRLAARHLRECGHERVAVVTGFDDQPAVQERLAGFDAAWAEAGGRASGLTRLDGEFKKAVTRERLRGLLATAPEVTGVFCLNDDMAAGALQATGALGRADVAMVGCDDVAFATMLHPALTTVRIPRETMARLAVCCLRDWRAARRDGIPAVRRTVTPELVVRESTKRAIRR